MHIEFSTNQEYIAFERLKRAFPTYIITKEVCEPLLRLVREGVIRIGDPIMYGGNAPLFAQKDLNEKELREIGVKWMISLKKKKLRRGNEPQ